MTHRRSTMKSSLEPNHRSLTAGLLRGPTRPHRRRRRAVDRTWRRGTTYVRRVGHGDTLLALVDEVQRHVENDADVVRIIRWMVNSGAVVLTGTFAGRGI